MDNEFSYEDKLLTKVAWYYYIEGYTQQEIGEYLSIPRLRVNRLLDKARKAGIIQFSVREGDSKRMIVERELITQFGLKDAFVVPSPLNEQDINESVAQAAAMYIHERLEKTGYINMGYGDTSSRILNHLANICEFPVNVVSLTGGVNYYLPNTRSNIFNAKLYLTPAPLLMASEDIVKAMEQEPSVKQIRHMATLAQMSIVGIGGVDSNATLLTNGTLNHSDVLLLSMQGAVGDMLCHFIDKDGNVIQSSLERRLMSTPLEQLKEMNNSIGVAGGSTKSEAILAALKGNYLDVLITDETTATNVLRLKNQE
ncbi:sugar-binding transcriptional regulator [Clostridiaceae bacterium AM27-36LB]|nr:sugar-binding transcriptional regulator [Clostridiales bacterium AM23-16LB]RHR44057.1 sugar-binding transcriptional regulator [Clostridiaceae bacterium AF18-31LB]RHT82583.1 sugar-binding transcriptional regulator [Clostridiaceae bacterium AM27-36LB]RHW04790.1 sugar-binding transcriptional regulator [Clostridiaceae bacterium OF09-1]